MEVAEQKLLKYKKDNNLIDIGDIKKLKIDQITSVSKRIIETNRALQKKQTDLTAIKLADGNVEELLAIPRATALPPEALLLGPAID